MDGPDGPPAIDGRYRVLRPLGEGGMGSVVLVEDLSRQGRVLALKSLRTRDGPEVGFLRREFDLLRRLRHPHIAAVEETGVDGRTGLPYFTSEWVNGLELREAWRSVRARPARWDLLYEWVAQVCRALDFLHRRGMVHLDLKPDNVLVTGLDGEGGGAGEVKLLDFGLALPVGSSLEGLVRGTLPYLAPEMVRGWPLDGRTDLYSLGAMLYEVLTGVLPFEAGEVRDLMRMHLERLPEPPRRRCPEIPEALEVVVLRLLAKERGRRFPSARGVLDALGRMTGRMLVLEDQATEAAAVLSADLVGRDRELGRLLAAARGLDQGAARPAGESPRRVVAILGTPGMGRARLLRELRQRVQMDGGRVLEARFPAPGLPFVVLCREVGGMPSDLPVDGLAMAHLHVAECLLAASLQKPFVLCAHDVDRADEASLAVLSVLARALVRADPPARMVLCLNSRTPVTGDPLERLLTELRDAGGLEEAVLGPLSPEEVKAQFASMFGLEDLPPGFVAELARLSGGVPRAVEELAREAVRQGVVRPGGEGWRLAGEAPPSPPGVDTPRDAPGDALGPGPVSVLELLAVLGREAELGWLTETWGGPPPELLAHLAELTRRGLVHAALTGSERRYGVARSDLAEATYGAIPPERRALLHGHVAAALGAGGMAVERAWHRVHAGRKGEAWEPGLAAAAEWRRLHAPGRAREFYLAMLRLQGLDAAEEALLHRLVGEVEALLGRVDEALASYSRALDRLRSAEGDPALVAQVSVALAALAARRGDPLDEVLQRVELAEGLFVRLGDAEGVAQTHDVVGEALQRLGRYGEALEAFRRGEDARRSSGSSPGLGVSARAIGAVLVQQNRYAEARDRYLEARPLLEAAGDLAGLASVENGLGLLAKEAGELLEAQERFRSALDLFQRTGHAQGRAMALMNLANVETALGRRMEALAALHEGERLSALLGDRLLQGRIVHSRGVIHAHAGEHPQALSCWTEAERLKRAVGDVGGLVTTCSCLGALLGAMGRPQEGRGWLEEAARTAEGLGDSVRLASALQNLAYLDAEQGWLRRAREGFRRASDLVSAAGHGEDRALLHENLGSVALGLGELGEAARETEASEVAAREAWDPLRLGASLRGRAAVAAARGEMAEARKWLAEAEPLLAQAQAKGQWVTLLLDRVEVLLARGELGEALNDQREAETLAIESSSDRDRLRVRLVGARLALEVGEGAWALEEAREVLAGLEALGLTLEAARARLLLAEAHLESGGPGAVVEAGRLVGEAWAVLAGSEGPWDRSECLMARAGLSMAGGPDPGKDPLASTLRTAGEEARLAGLRPLAARLAGAAAEREAGEVGAEEALLGVVQEAEAMGMGTLAWRTHHALGRVLAARGRRAEAARHYTAALVRLTETGARLEQARGRGLAYLERRRCKALREEAAGVMGSP